MKSSDVLILVLAFISVSAFGEEKKNYVVVTYPEATEVDAESKEIEDLKQMIADIVVKAFYNYNYKKKT